VTVSQATRSFEEHAANTSPIPARVVSITPLFVPFWVFLSGNATSAIYAGRRVPRSVAHAIIRSPELAAATAFDVTMLSDGVGDERRAALEPYALFERVAWSLARPAESGVATPRESRRVLAPAYVIEFVSLGVVRQTGYVSGLSSRVWSAAEAVPGASAYAAIATRVRFADAIVRRFADSLLRTHLPPDAWRALALLAATFTRTIARFLFFPPVAMALATIAATAIIAPAAKQRQVLRDWEAQVAAELEKQKGMSDEWVWRTLARAAWRDAAHASAARGGASTSSARQRKRIPPVNENDFAAVLGVGKGASTADIQAAFRREMLIYHPDHALANGFDEKDAGERTRIILRAYRELRASAI
jgi:hypothetical protein